MSLLSSITKGIRFGSTLTAKSLFQPKITFNQPILLKSINLLKPNTILPFNNSVTPFEYASLRHASNLAPRRRKYKKAQKGRVPVRTGGSQKGNSIVFGQYGIRVKEGLRLTASVITACHNVIRRKVKPAKGTKIWLRVFPDIPVTSKGNESRMGKGKGSFEYWACRVPKDKILFEIAGPNLPLELAKEAFRLAADCLPVKSQFVDKDNDPLQIKLKELQSLQKVDEIKEVKATV